MRCLSFISGLLLSAAVIGSALLTPAAAKRKPPPPPPPPPPSSTTDTYVKNYGSVIGGQKCGLTPEAVQSASDGGSALLALSTTTSVYSSEFCGGASWVAKLDTFGKPQWQEVVGCCQSCHSHG